MPTKRPQRTPIVFVLLFLGALPAQGQYFKQSSYWKTHRQELTLGLGISNFLGELGGRDRVGSDFVWDLEFSQTRPATSFGYRYYVARKHSFRLNFSYGILAGNDNLTREPFRSNRNLHFKSDVLELALLYELHLYREELGHVYDLRGVKGTKASRIGIYFFGGIGGLHFQPKALFNNTWVALQPLRTEGQGLLNGPEEYNTLGICIPMGLGVRKAFNRQLSGGIELQYTKTFTDYIDDVSGFYYDKEVIRGVSGDIGAYLADPSLGTLSLPHLEGLNPTATGEQRGDPDDLDAYLFLKAHLHYKLYKYRSGSKKYRARIRRQKIVF